MWQSALFPCLLQQGASVSLPGHGGCFGNTWLLFSRPFIWLLVHELSCYVMISGDSEVCLFAWLVFFFFSKRGDHTRITGTVYAIGPHN